MKDNFLGKKLNEVWLATRELSESVNKTLSDGLKSVATSLDNLSKAQTEQKSTLDKLLITSEKDTGKRIVEGEVSVKDLYTEIDKALKENKPKDVDYPELEKMFVALGKQVDGTKLNVKALAVELAKVLPKQKELTIDKKIEVFGKVLTKIEGNTPKTPLYVSVVNADEIGNKTVVSHGGGSSAGGVGSSEGLATEATLLAILAKIDIYVHNESPAGLRNGVNAIYTTTNNYKVNTLRVYLNGIRQAKTGDYSETSANTFTFVVAPLVSDTIIIDYVKQ